MPPMAHFRVVYAGHASEEFWAIERVDDDGLVAKLRQLFKVRQDAEAEAMRLNLLEAEKNS